MGSQQHEADATEIVNGTANEAILYVNGVRRVLPSGSAHLTLLEYLRGNGLTGTKLGCGEGGCGACTVMVSKYIRKTKKCVHIAVNACLAPLYSVEGMHIITIEGVGNRRNGLHPIQESMALAHGSQCGFCTPGFIMSLYALLRSSPQPPSEHNIEDSLSGNLCRCTGYRPILDAFRVFAKSSDDLYTGIPDAGNSKICPTSGKPCSCNEDTLINGRYPLPYSVVEGSRYSETELIFPPELLLRTPSSLSLTGLNGLKWFRVTTLGDLLEVKSRFPEAKLVVGNTEVGIEMRLKRIEYKTLIFAGNIDELNVLKTIENGLVIGAGVTLTELMRFLESVIDERPTHKVSSCEALYGQLKWFAGTQIRNVASVGGNICTASPISDLNPLWMASRAEFSVVGYGGSVRTVKADEFFLGYRKVDLRDHEILLSVFLPWARRLEFVKEFKQSHRRDDDIAIVNAGMRVFLNDDGVVSDAAIVYGGVAPCSLPCVGLNEFLKGKMWKTDLLISGLQVLRNDVTIDDGAPGGMVEFRKSLVVSFFFKFFNWVSHLMDETTVPASHMSAFSPFHRPSLMGTQDYEIVKSGTSVGTPALHLSSRLQVTGEAEYTDDYPLPATALHASLILSTKPHARIVSIDGSRARVSPGFAGVFFAKDVPADNRIGAVIHDEEVFASEFVTCVGHVIGIVVADTHENARFAADRVAIVYEELPAIFSIEEAIKAKSFHPNCERRFEKGDVDKCFESDECDDVIEGEVNVGGQEHFYLEPHTSVIWCVDDGNEVHMLSSTQAPQKHQLFVSSVLGLPLSKVVCKTKRIGGGFGGKETRSAFICAAASVPAYLLNRPVKITLDRDVDMKITGQRHSFLGKYKVGFTKDGKVVALQLELFSNGGNSLDLSSAVLDRAMFHSDNVYSVSHVRIRGNVCFTNLPTNTAFRGFGGPQGMIIAENWIHRIATTLSKTPEEIRELNFQRDGYELHYGQIVQNSTLLPLWNELKARCDFEKAREQANDFNARNRWKKRGVAMIPTKFGISFTTKMMNQAGALVHVYTDGTVLVTHGGVEMGQGLHTKVAQVAASAFNIPLSDVFVSETSTDKVPNSSPTAASASSDMYGEAVLDACNKIKRRMKPIEAKGSFSSFAEVARACYMERIDLCEHGFHITPEIDFDWSTGKGTPFRYFTYGAAFAEVEIDTLTGDFHTRCADVALDLGYSLNPPIDVGQIEGAFMQGLGWATMEEVKWGDASHPWVRAGHLYTCGPGTYKIPAMNDVPFRFHVSLLKGHPNAKAVHSSKAVGEPPFFLASAVFFAIKEAVSAARAEDGVCGWFPLDTPATPERLRMACLDAFVAPFVTPAFRPNLSV